MALSTDLSRSAGVAASVAAASMLSAAAVQDPPAAC